MIREARILTALAATDIPHPRLLALCADPTPLGAPFYLMEAVDGFNAHAALPRRFADSPSLRRNLGFVLVDTLALLSKVDHTSVGLSDLSRVDEFLERQSSRWRAQLEGYLKHSSWPGPAELGPVEEVTEWLKVNTPSRFQPGIIHGDYHMANVLFHPFKAEIAAIVDWELATLGDPLLDLGWLLTHWPSPDGEGRATTGARPWSGFPAAPELVERYAAQTGRNLADLRWFAVLAAFKRAAIIEGTYARACAGLVPLEIGQRLHRNAVALIGRAAGWAAGGDI